MKRPVKRIALLLFCLAAAIGFATLGAWQLERRAWKLDLMARVDARIHAAPVPAPPPVRWQAITAQSDEYRRLRLEGRFRHEYTTWVDALTERGPGFWVLTPLVTADGTVLVNRGFVPPDHKRDIARPDGQVTVTGLLRLTEPDGRILRPNQPQAGLWYSRDVVAIAAADHLGPVAPFFVDAERENTTAYPIGGMTVVQFRNAHLIYALTWFGLAGLMLWGAIRVFKAA